MLRQWNERNAERINVPVFTSMQVGISDPVPEMDGERALVFEFHGHKNEGAIIAAIPYDVAVPAVLAFAAEIAKFEGQQ